MKLEHIYAGLRDILLAQRIISPDTAIPHLPLLGAGGVMDSLTSIRFIDAVERRFSVDILGDLNLDCLETTDHLARFIAAAAPPVNGSAPADYVIASMPGRTVIGRHVIMDCHRLPDALLNDSHAIQSLVHALAEAIGATIVNETYHAFTPAGVTGLAIVSASHIAIHTWPEYGYLGVDIFSCQELDASVLKTVITTRFPDAGCHLRLFDRVAETGVQAGTVI